MFIKFQCTLQLFELLLWVKQRPDHNTLLAEGHSLACKVDQAE